MVNTSGPGTVAQKAVDEDSSPSDCGYCGSEVVSTIEKALSALDSGRLDIARDLLRSFLARQGGDEPSC